jgi:hypothetical protein
MRRLMSLAAVVFLCACVKPTQQSTPPPISYATLSDFQQQAVAQASTSQFCVQPGLLAIGNYALPAPVGGCVTFSGGSGDAKIYVAEDGKLVAAVTAGIVISAETGQMTHTDVATPEFPDSSVPICDLTVTNGAYTVDQCGLASRVRLGVLHAGIGLKKTTSAGISRIEVDPAQVCMQGGECGGTSPPAAALPFWFPVAGGQAQGTADAGAGWWVRQETGGGAKLGYGGSATFGKAYLIFPEAESFAQLNYLLPSSWDGKVAMRIAWQPADGSTAGQVCDLRVATVCAKPGIRFGSSPTWGAEQSPAGLTVTGENHWQIATVDTLTVAGCAAGDLLSIQFHRVPGSTLSVGVRVFGVELSVGVK